MILQHLSILNYKNISSADLHLSAKLNCFFGMNGMGKTNLLDAVYYLSFWKSSTAPSDSQNILHGEDMLMIQGEYVNEQGDPEEIYCGFKRGKKKIFKHNKKEYRKLSEHIGFIPLVMISPADSTLISGGSEERRKFMDMVISQYDKTYLHELIKYNKSLEQRNAMLKGDNSPNEELMSLLEEMMAASGNTVYEKRKDFTNKLTPIFNRIYAFISGNECENVSLGYTSHATDGKLLETIRSNRDKDRIMGFSLKGIHKDDIEMSLNGYPMKKEGSQGQNKTFLTALKLAQFYFLKQNGHTVPILLLDDIFDKLDKVRVENIITLVSGEDFGQIFISDTERSRFDNILQKTGNEHKIFSVENGTITES